VSGWLNINRLLLPLLLLFTLLAQAETLEGKVDKNLHLVNGVEADVN